MFRLETDEFSSDKQNTAMRVDRRALVRFHAGLRGPSLWIVTPRSLFHRERRSRGDLTEFGQQIKCLIQTNQFHRIKYGTNEPDVIYATNTLHPNAHGGRNRLVWKKTEAFTPLGVTHHSVHADFLPPRQEMLSHCINQEVPSLGARQSCLILVPDTTMEGLLDEQGSRPEHYAYDMIITFHPRFAEQNDRDDEDVRVYI